MDVLSDVLRLVRLEGALFFNAEFSSPWCLSSRGATALAPYVSRGAAHLIIYHFLTEGRAYVRLPELPSEELVAGDIVILPHGSAHLLGNGRDVEPVDSIRTFPEHLKEGLKVARFGGGGESTKFVCGYLVCEPRLSEVFLSGLPPLVKLHLVGEPSDQWLEHSIRFSVSQDNQGGAGSGLVNSKLAELLFVETMRRYITSLPADATGWLAGARDVTIGQALAHLHKDPSHHWTISGLAHEVGLSRTQLADRFRHFLGNSPMAYLAQWRLKLAADLLQSTEDSVAEIAVAVGYESEAGFNRAFKREFNLPPAQFRRAQKLRG